MAQPLVSSLLPLEWFLSSHGSTSKQHRKRKSLQVRCFSPQGLASALVWWANGQSRR